MKKNIILIIILVVMSWLYFWLNYINDTSRVKNNNSNVDISFNNFNYDKIKSENLEIKSKKIVYTWTWDFIQDDKKVDKFIEDLKNIKVLSLSSTNKDNFDKFWVNNTWSILQLWKSEIFLWNAKWWMWQEYIKLSWIDKVFLINKDLKNFLNKDSNFFKKEDKVNLKSKEGTLGQKVIEDSKSWTWKIFIWTWTENNNWK